MKCIEEQCLGSTLQQPGGFVPSLSVKMYKKPCMVMWHPLKLGCTKLGLFMSLNSEMSPGAHAVINIIVNTKFSCTNRYQLGLLGVSV